MIVILVEFQSLEKTAPRATLHKNFAIKHNETKSIRKDSEKYYMYWKVVSNYNNDVQKRHQKIVSKSDACLSLNPLTKNTYNKYENVASKATIWWKIHQIVSKSDARIKSTPIDLEQMQSGLCPAHWKVWC